MADNVVHLERKPLWQASFDLYRDPDGKLVVVLTDARTSWIEGPGSPATKLHSMAFMVEEGLERMRDNAQALQGASDV